MKLYFTEIYSEDDGGWYANIFDREGKDVAVVPEDGVASSRREASSLAVAKIEELSGSAVRAPSID